MSCHVAGNVPGFAGRRIHFFRCKGVSSARTCPANRRFGWAGAGPMRSMLHRSIFPAPKPPRRDSLTPLPLREDSTRPW